MDISENMAMDISLDPGYDRTTAPDMVLSSLLSPDVIMASGNCSDLSDGHHPATRRSLDNNMALGGGPDLMQVHGLI